ncbi:undecaprenyldiphospho-muramoylpentapeptide beta-N-acetylglucosaminyltransferase [Rhodothermus profundi]|uniref:UDP-N-acetylglucosamine--N-acetylmuramyl-(pentapeptide) pyrophosphoryl-undecaprenol N-acetylglucosamine transferase n=1 Tax=Rhodothermus profundi TaxID=633813 RepID=A0A1M6RFS4_9BACT|nr:undecaprenyldiphospho-muramoylpentapeptide beta-N-acetylglucosaminyltransferase [Rhodothermus profundi]SHK31246.1 UDP-N-acetylglucosamine-N-acetylmuramylpentapeptide N-acetylglucosamine transferase [Rhodothermus profundi]
MTEVLWREPEVPRAVLAAAGKAPRVLLTGGGTGGHVYPAIAIAEAIQAQCPEAVIAFAGTRERLEWRAVPAAGFSIYPITAAALPRRWSLRMAQVPWKLMRGFAESLQLVRSFDPNVVIGTGGYVSAPVLLAARLLGRPFVLQEQNAFPGLTNRLLGRWAARVYIAFPEAQDYFPEDRCVLSGNPVRAALRQIARPEARHRFGLPVASQVLFVFGGSLGSMVLNEALLQVLPTLLDEPQLHLLWQTGRKHYEHVRQRLETLAKPLRHRIRLLPYVEDMAAAYAAADLVLCRAGALTCSELMVTGTPAILVPARQVAADHQTHNAESMERAGAARHVPEAELPQRLVREVWTLLADAERRAAMAQAARRMARPQAAAQIASEVLELTTHGRVQSEKKCYG